MQHHVLIFEDADSDRKKLEKSLRDAGCSVLSFAHHRPEEEAAKIREFSPDLAVVDSRFSSPIDGFDVIKNLRRISPSVKVVICSVLLNDSSRSEWIRRQYQGLPGLQGLLPKNPFPTAEQILSYL